MKLRLCGMLLISFSFFFIAKGQDNAGITFNKVKPEDFSIKNYFVDTSLGAVIVADIGKSYFEGNKDGWFTLVHEVKRRVRIIDKKGFDLATVYVQLFKSNENKEEKLENVRATTYNLEDGKVIETKLDKDDVFKDKVNDDYIVKKFTMPSVKEGSILEYSYTLKSEFTLHLQPWSFQGEYPILWSEYEVSIPQFFKYVTLARGYLPFHFKKSSVKPTSYLVSEQRGGDASNRSAAYKTEHFTIASENTITKWAVKNVPALKEEKFTSSINNHVCAIEFQLAAYIFPNTPYKSILGSWASVTEDLMKNKNFGVELSQAKRWVNDEPELSAKTAVNLEEARKIFKFVQENVKNKGNRGFYLSQPLKETFKSKSGHSADINMLLTFILDRKGFTASPVLLSTRSNGVAFDIYPLINRFNYVVCRLTIDDVNYYLDASQTYLGFNKLPAYCYNGPARVINKSSEAEYFAADSLKEAKSTTVLLTVDYDNPKNWLGYVQTKLGYNESSTARQKITADGKETFIKKISESHSGDFKVSDVELLKLEKQEEDLVVKYKINIDNSGSDIIYFSPFMHEGWGENPFKSETRKYPVEMSNTINESYTLKMFIPAGYVIDEIPKSERVIYNENEGIFEYLVYKSDTEITIKTVLKLNKATFLNEDYESLRSFFGHIVRKQAEQIVLKKK